MQFNAFLFHTFGNNMASRDSSIVKYINHFSTSVPDSIETTPIDHDFFDDQKANEVLQYYKFYKKLPKICPEKLTEYPTCEPGTSWISSCHNCECNEHGRHECTKIDDCVLDKELYGKEVNTVT